MSAGMGLVILSCIGVSDGMLICSVFSKYVSLQFSNRFYFENQDKNTFRTATCFWPKSGPHSLFSSGPGGLMSFCWLLVARHGPNMHNIRTMLTVGITAASVPEVDQICFGTDGPNA